MISHSLLDISSVYGEQNKWKIALKMQYPFHSQPISSKLPKSCYKSRETGRYKAFLYTM
jgi:hypothetical protein